MKVSVVEIRAKVQILRSTRRKFARQKVKAERHMSRDRSWSPKRSCHPTQTFGGRANMEVGACFIRSDICMRVLYAGLITNIAMRRYNAPLAYMWPCATSHMGFYGPWLVLAEIGHIQTISVWPKRRLHRRNSWWVLQEGGSRRSTEVPPVAVQIGSSVVRAFVKWATSVRVTYVLNCWGL